MILILTVLLASLLVYAFRRALRFRELMIPRIMKFGTHQI